MPRSTRRFIRSSSSGRRRPVRVAHDRRPDLSVRHQVDDVGAGAMGVDRREVLGDVEHAAAAVAGDDRGHALGEVVARSAAFAGSVIPSSEWVCRSMNPGATISDEASMTLACRLDLERADRDDPIAAHGQIGLSSGRAGAVDQRAPLQDEIGDDTRPALSTGGFDSLAGVSPHAIATTHIEDATVSSRVRHVLWPAIVNCLPPGPRTHRPRFARSLPARPADRRLRGSRQDLADHLAGDVGQAEAPAVVLVGSRS